MRTKLVQTVALLLLLSLIIAVPLFRHGKLSFIIWLDGHGTRLTSIEPVCHSRKCRAALDSAMGSTNRVPRIRHLLWKSDQVSAYFAKQLQSWGDIHPGWTYILWRDADLTILTFQFGGVYADLDYILVRSLDLFLKYPAVVPIETEAFALFYFGMNTWPPELLGNPAFMFSEPQNPFFHFCILQLMANPASSVFTFAGPLGLSAMLKRYAADRPRINNLGDVVYVPASRAFSSYANNSLRSSTSEYKASIIDHLNRQCVAVRQSNSAPSELRSYCKDVYNLDPITDRSELVFAIHDSNKARSSYDARGSPQFYENAVNIRSVLPNILMASEII